MKTLLFIFTLALATLFTSNAFAGPWHYQAQDIKLPTQVVLEHDSWATPIVATAARLKSGAAISSSAATTITSFAAQPDYARNITLTPTGTTANVGAGTAVVSGLNIFGKAISENFTITSTQSTATTGNKAFASVSSVVFPQASGSGVTLSIGVGSKLGLRRCLANAGDYVFSEFGSAYETTRGTAANNVSAIESNTFIPNGTMDGATKVDAFYVENFRCYPGQ